MKIRRVVVAGLIAGAAIGVSSAVIAAPPVPPWVGEDGRDNPEKYPAFVNLLDCQGNVVGRRANPFADDAPPYLPPAAPARNGNPACEAGGGLIIEDFPATPSP